MSQTAIRTTGERGETLASEHLAGQGYAVLVRNWRTRGGEIDIIARSLEGVIVFVEVKTRRAAEADPLESITLRKRRRLIGAAQVYLAQNHLTDAQWRIDVIAVTFAPRQPPHIEHFQDAFDW
ncbi:MAG: YraN family protein [Anaerolineae bacterium]|nr:YraN family protein [Anaerolineae bacterium]NUQ03840.1 YraN family protein [Anaerolineae bacterium]